MPILASLLIAVAAAAGDADASTRCLAELRLNAVPIANPTHLFLYRRCLNTKNADAQANQHVERRLQRMDQYFWRDKENTEEKKILTERQHARDVRWNQKRKVDQQRGGKTRVEILQRNRRKVRAQVRQLERERDAKGEQ